MDKVLSTCVRTLPRHLKTLNIYRSTKWNFCSVPTIASNASGHADGDKNDASESMKKYLHSLSPPTVSREAALENKSKFPGCKEASFVTSFSFLDPNSVEGIPVYRLIDTEGTALVDDLEFDPDLAVSMHCSMIMVRAFDEVMMEKHEEGYFRFFMQSTGEEATQVATAAALNPGDLIFSQYRETGVILRRKVPVKTVIHQYIGNAGSLDKGRLMPNMMGSKEHNIVTQSPPLGTQIPQASGAAYGFKRKGSNNCVVCYFGEGTASEGDFHAGFNLAAVHDCPIVFICRNNGFSVSTRSQEQYRGDGIASRAYGYGILCIRVDGNDVLAVHRATQEARRLAVSESRPVLVEAMTYRAGEHSSKVEVLNYRTDEEVEEWAKGNNPITRSRQFLINNGLWDLDKEQKLHLDLRNEISDAFEAAAAEKNLNPETLFDDVYDELPPLLQKQREEMKKHASMYAEHFPLDKYHPMH